jgi:hypothetical protein
VKYGTETDQTYNYNIIREILFVSGKLQTWQRCYIFKSRLNNLTHRINLINNLFTKIIVKK